jgi:hypothetical protein
VRRRRVTLRELGALYQRDGLVVEVVGQLAIALARDGRFAAIAVLAPGRSFACEVAG